MQGIKLDTLGVPTSLGTLLVAWLGALYQINLEDDLFCFLVCVQPSHVNSSLVSARILPGL